MCSVKGLVGVCLASDPGLCCLLGNHCCVKGGGELELRSSLNTDFTRPAGCRVNKASRV